MDDDVVSRIFLSNVLRKAGHSVQVAKSGVEAIGLFRDKLNVDLVLMDLKMPDMDGYSAIGHIRAIDQEVVIIVQSAIEAAQGKEKALTAGCNDYIDKPIDLNELWRMIGKYLKT